MVEVVLLTNLDDPWKVLNLKLGFT